MYFIRLLILPLIILVVSSCEGHYFHSPQPVDRRDLLEIPRALLGKWSDSAGGDDGRETIAKYLVERDRLWVIEMTYLEVIDAIKPRGNGMDTLNYNSEALRYMRELRWDSAVGAMDTVVNFIVRGRMIYGVDKEDLVKGSPFTRDGDTIRFTHMDTACFEIGHHFRVRQVGKDMWALNFLDGFYRDAKGWWQIVFVERRNAKLVLYTVSDKMASHTSLVGKVAYKYHHVLDLNSADVRSLLRDSLFTHANTLEPN